MKINSLEGAGVPHCAYAGIRILAKTNDEEIKTLAKILRKDIPMDVNEFFLPKGSRNLDTDFDWLYDHEILKILKHFNIQTKKLPFKGKYKNLYKKFPLKGTFVIFVTSHVLILHNGKLYDNIHKGISPRYYRYWLRDKVEKMFKVTRKKTKFKIKIKQPPKDTITVSFNNQTFTFTTNDALTIFA